jgi:signal transduction histidine kinase
MSHDDIYAQLARVSLDDPQSFTDSVLTVLCRHFGVAAASLHIYTEGAALLRLRSQVGFDYRRYDGFDLPIESHAGHAVTDGKPDQCADLLGSRYFINKSLIEGSNIRHLYTVPMVLEDDAAREAASRFGASSPLGAMSFYSESELSEDTRGLLADGYVPFVSRLYLATLERSLMDLRARTVKRVAYRRDVGSLAHTFLELITSYLSFEAGSLWVLDARRNVIYRRKVFPLPRTDDAGPPDSVGLETDEPRTDDAQNLVRRAFSDGLTLIHDEHNPVVDPGTVHLAQRQPVRNWIAVPIKLPASARLQGRRLHAGGVLELADHYTEFAGVRRKSALTWEERHMVQFACELLSVLMYQVLRTQDHAADFERMTHGARQALLAVNNHLELLDKTQVVQALPPSSRHVVANALDWVQDMSMQLNLDEIIREAALETEEVALWSNVLAKLPDTLARMNTRSKPGFALHLDMDAPARSFRQIPPVRGNARGLDCVFRNLLDNSRKYCRPPNGPRVAMVTADVGDGCVRVRFSDNGPGIPTTDREQIFEDGFRGDIARGTQTQGLGRGLYDCRRLMEAMKGSITYEGDGAAADTAFVVSIPVFEGR